MKLKFKHQKFQEDASNAICDIFEGNNKSGTLRYLKDNGFIEGNLDLENDAYKNGDINLEENTILANIQKIQNKQYLEVSRDLYITKNKNETSSYNFSVEMETGTGKTYTYIKTFKSEKTIKNYKSKIFCYANRKEIFYGNFNGCIVRFVFWNNWNYNRWINRHFFKKKFK